jgi:hypothetical protein
MGDHGYYDDAHATRDWPHFVGRTTDPYTGPTRDVTALRLRELLPADVRSHTRRAPVVIDGQTLSETLRQRLTREHAELETAITALASQLARRSEQIKRLERFPEIDPFADGTVLQFQKAFPSTPDTTYSYVAHRVNGLWYLTGARSPQDMTWDAFVSWLGLGVETVYQLSVTGKSRRKVIG